MSARIRRPELGRGPKSRRRPAADKHATDHSDDDNNLLLALRDETPTAVTRRSYRKRNEKKIKNEN